MAKIERVWDIIEKVHVCMLTTRFFGGMRARPVDARLDRASGVIWFLTDARSGKEGEIEADPEVGLSFVDARERAYVSITGHAEILQDPARARQIWKGSDRTWWEGPEDPNLRVLRVEPQIAEIWDGPSSTAAMVYELAKARVTGEKPNVGENRKATIKL